MQQVNSSIDAINPTKSSEFNGWAMQRISVPALACIFLLVPLVFGMPLIRDAFPVLYPVVGSRAFICLIELTFCMVVLIGFAGQTKINKFFSLLFLAWIISVIFSTISAEKFIPAIVRQSEWFSHILFSFCLYVLLSEIRCFNFFLFSLTISGFLLFLSVLCLLWFNVPDHSAINWVIATPGFRNIRHFGYYNAAAIIFACGLLLSHSPLLKILGIVFMIVGWVFVFWAGGRGTFISLILSVCIIKIFLWKKNYSFFRLFILTALAGLILQLIIFPDANGSLGVKRWADKFDGSIANGDIDNLASGRMVIWEKAFIHTLERPLLGFGPDGFIYLQPNPAPGAVQPHNVLLQLIIEWGVIGLMFFMAIGLTLVFFSVKKIKEDLSDEVNFARITGLWLVINYAVFGLVDGTFYHPFPLCFLSIGFAMALQGITVSHDSPLISVSSFNIVPLCVVLVMIMTLHFSVLSLQRGNLEPGDWQLNIIKIFPSSLLDFRSTLEKWLYNGKTDAVIEWSRWAQHNARFPATFRQLEEKALVKREVSGVH